MEIDVSFRGSADLGNLLSKITVMSGRATSTRGSFKLRRPRTVVAAYDKKAMLDNWIGEELSKFEIKQEEKAGKLAKELETVSGGPTRYSHGQQTAA